MLLSAIVTVCSLMGTGEKTCDVRVLMVYDAPSMKQCNKETQETAHKVSQDSLKANKGSIILVSNGDCMKIDEMKDAVNAAPEAMAREGYTYKLTLY